MSTVDLDAIRDLAARYAAATWDEEDGLARDLAAEVPALLVEVEQLRAEVDERDAELSTLGQDLEVQTLAAFQNQAEANMFRSLGSAEVKRLSAVLAAARAAYVDLARREIQHAGSGRDGHLAVRDLDPLRRALADISPDMPPCPSCDGEGVRWCDNVFDLCRCQSLADVVKALVDEPS